VADSGTRLSTDCYPANEPKEAIMSDHWRASRDRFEDMRGNVDDQAAYAAGWTISGLATLGAIVAVWIFAI
jgi:hypothetical protein